MKSSTLNVSSIQTSRSTFYLGLNDYRVTNNTKIAPQDPPPPQQFKQPPIIHNNNNNNNNNTHNSGSGNKNKKHKYEICLGYQCYDLVLHDRHVFIYSLQKNKEALSDLVNSATTAPVNNTRVRNGEFFFINFLSLMFYEWKLYKFYVGMVTLNF
jgi:hypothetical protein